MVEFKAELVQALLDYVGFAANRFLQLGGAVPPFGLVLGPAVNDVDMVHASDNAEAESNIVPHGEEAWKQADAVVQAKLRRRSRAPGTLATAQATQIETTQGMAVGIQIEFADTHWVALLPYAQGKKGWEFGELVPWKGLLFEPQGLDFKPELSAEGSAWLDGACTEMDQLQGLLERRWRLRGPSRVAFDREARALQFEYADGRRLEAKAEVLGTYRTRDRSWNWGWDQEDLAPFAAGAPELKAVGERFGLDYMRVPAYPVPDASFLGLLTAVGVKATRAVGHYTAAVPSEGLEIIYLLKGVRTKGQS